MAAKTVETVPTGALIRKGYFPIELPPPFVTGTLADCLFLLPELQYLEPRFSRPALFSIPKSWPARRVLSIPNPLHQILLAESVEKHWEDLSRIFSSSTLSL